MTDQRHKGNETPDRQQKRTEADEPLNRQIQRGLELMDRIYPDKTPSLNSIEQFVAVEKSRLRNWLWKELVVFWLAALVILSMTAIVYVQEIVYVAWIQSISMLAFPVSLPLLLNRKSRKRGDRHDA